MPYDIISLIIKLLKTLNILKALQSKIQNMHCSYICGIYAWVIS